MSDSRQKPKIYAPVQSDDLTIGTDYPPIEFLSTSKLSTPGPIRDLGWATGIYSRPQYKIETREEFTVRSRRKFIESEQIFGSEIERAVYEYLLEKLLLCHVYADVSDEMLHQAIIDTNDIVRHCTQETTGVSRLRMRPSCAR